MKKTKPTYQGKAKNRNSRKGLSLYSRTLQPFFMPTIAVMIMWLLFMGFTKNLRTQMVWNGPVIHEWQDLTHRVIFEQGLIWEVDK